MSAVERICPNCGMTNSATQAHCLRCHTNLITLSSPGQTKLVPRPENAQSTALVLGVTALIVRVGLNVLARGILPRLLKGAGAKKALSPTKQPISEERPDYIVRGWRSWSIYRGGERSSGSEQFEWRIKRNKQ